MEVQTVISPGGIEAWLVEDYAEPMFSLRFALQGGIAQDPPGKEGLANFLALTLLLGAGDLTEVEFARAKIELAIEVELRLEWDALVCGIEALSETRSETAALINLALSRPRFDAKTVEWARRRMLSFHGREALAPRIVAVEQWSAVAFAGHPYANKQAGTAESVSAITVEDLETQHRRLFARDRLKVVAVGDITAEELGEFLDRLFAGLPAKAELTAIPVATPVTGGRVRVAELDIPQSVVTFGTMAVPYDSRDFMPAIVLSHILGGHAVFSRLGREMRDKRGLTYAAQAWLEHQDHAAVLSGIVSTRNDMVAQSLDIVRTEMQSMADGNLSQEELDAAKSFLIGNLPLALGSPAKIAAQLLRNAMAGFGADHLDARRALLAAVTLDDAKRVAKYLLDPENLIISIAGAPVLQPARAT